MVYLKPSDIGNQQSRVVPKLITAPQRLNVEPGPVARETMAVAVRRLLY